MRVDLLKLQRDLAALTLGQLPDDAGAYIRSVADSEGMRVTRAIIASWRELMIRRLCPLTASLLNRTGRLQAELDALSSTRASAWLEELAIKFLDRFADDHDRIVAASSSFERAAIMARQGAIDHATIVWPCDPEELVRRLAAGAPIAGIAEGSFEIVVSAV